MLVPLFLLVVKIKKLEINYLKTHNRTKNIINPTQYTQMTFNTDDKFNEAYFNTPNVVLFRIKFDTLAITMTNQCFLNNMGYSMENITQNQVGLDEIIVIKNVPFIIEELEIFGEISSFQTKAQRKDNTRFWTFFSGKLSADQQFVDCSLVIN